MKKDDEIRNILASRFDREMLLALLQVDKVDLDLDTSVRKASVDPWCNPVHTHTDMLDHTPACKPAVEIHNLVEVEVDIDLEDTHQMVDIDQQLEKAEGKGHIPNILVS